jgi:putative hydroxymethylpyrimidine transport system substrate-binding protein
LTRRLTLVALALVALTLAACGERTEPTGAPTAQSLRLMLDYFPNADHAGIYAAHANGDFRRAGLNVAVQAPSDPSAPLKLLAAGRVDLAISYEPELLLARDAGAEDLVSVAALVQAPLTSLMALPSANVHSAKDLAGKRVGTAGIGYQHAYLQTILQHAGVDPGSVKETDVGFNLVPAMVSKKVAATLGAYWNYEGIQLARQHKRPVILRMDQLGVPTYDELVVVARRQSLDTAGASRLRRFLNATAAGYRLLQTEPSAGVDALAQASHGIDKGLQAASIQATLPVFFPKDPRRPWGWQDFGAWAAYERWMRANHLLKRPPSEAPPLTNEFLAGQGA